MATADNIKSEQDTPSHIPDIPLDQFNQFNKLNPIGVVYCHDEDGITDKEMFVKGFQDLQNIKPEGRLNRMQGRHVLKIANKLFLSCNFANTFRVTSQILFKKFSKHFELWC